MADRATVPGAEETLRSASRGPLRPDGVARDVLRTRRGRRALWTGIVISAVLHLGLWVLGPDVRFPSPDALRAESGIELLPALDDPSPPAVEVPAAPEPIPRPAEPVAAPSAGEEAEKPPTFIPHDVRPRLTNAIFIQDYLEAFYPPTMRSSGLEARVRLWLFVTREGSVDRVRVQSPSGLPAFDSLAVSAASVMEFRPALSGDQTVGVWVEQWITFQVEPPTPSPIAAEPPGDD